MNTPQVRRCRLSSLLDLNHDTDYVRSKVAGFINDLISMGVAGVRLDAAKHMYPGNIAAILNMTTDLRTDVSKYLATNFNYIQHRFSALVNVRTVYRR